jgi:transcriptional regulator with XRE-family HTH domain
MQKFGQRVRELRRAKNLGQRALAAKMGVSFTYVSRIECETLDFGPYLSEEWICKLAKALDANPDELLLLPKKIPEPIRRRVLAGTAQRLPHRPSNLATMSCELPR